MVKNLLQRFGDQLGILLGWLVLILIIDPSGDFPLNDDWCYAKSVQTLVETGSLKLYNWGEMTLVAHVYWGALFAKLFGFTFTVLRWSTLVMGGAALVGTYALCKVVNMPRWARILGVCLLALNPVFLALSNSFMTDIPFTAVIVWSSYFFVRAYQTNQLAPLLMAIAFTGWAFLIRQLALVLPLAWLAGMVLTQKMSARNWLRAVLPGLALAALYFIYSFGMEAAGLLQDRYNDKLGVLAGVLTDLTWKRLVNIPGYLITTLAYLGVFLLPLALLLGQKQQWRRYRWWFLLAIIVLPIVLADAGKLLPSLDNVWIDTGVGPTTTVDFYDRFTESPGPHFWAPIWYLVTLLGVAGACGLVLPVITGLRMLMQRKTVQPHWIFGLALVSIYLAPFIVVGIYDRYIVTLIPFALLLIAPALPKTPPIPRLRQAAAVFVLLFGGFSVAATHDYLSWNRARWAGIEALLDDGVADLQIAGGVEFDAWYHYSDADPEWWTRSTDEYRVVFEPAPGEEIIDTFPYNRWLPGKGLMYTTKVDKLLKPRRE